MTGSYFRGDSDPILLPEIEKLFSKITYSYYEQLNGYEYLESLGIGYHFYQGAYTEAIADVLDVSKKTIIHIPHVNSKESTQDKYGELGFILDVIGEHVSDDEETGIISMKTADGKIVKVADLVDEEGRERVQKYLRNVNSADDIDIIIALGMAKEGFDWEYCEHALTIGYRASLTEIIQIIGRATRDSEGKSHAQFTNLIAQPNATDESVKTATNDMIKAITASLLMEQVLAPNFKFKPKSPSKDEKDKKGKGFEIKGLKEPSTKRTKEIIEQDLTDLTAKIYQDARAKQTMGTDIDAKVVTRHIIPKIIEESYPDLDKEQIEEVRQHLLATNFLKGSEFDATKNAIFVKSVDKFINIDDLSIDLIDSVNPFQRAYEILSKSISKEMY